MLFSMLWDSWKICLLLTAYLETKSPFPDNWTSLGKQQFHFPRCFLPLFLGGKVLRYFLRCWHFKEGETLLSCIVTLKSCNATYRKDNLIWFKSNFYFCSGDEHPPVESTNEALSDLQIPGPFARRNFHLAFSTPFLWVPEPTGVKTMLFLASWEASLGSQISLLIQTPGGGAWMEVSPCDLGAQRRLS